MEVSGGKGTLTGMQWRDLSLKGKLCAIVPCTCAPARRCRECGIHYCRHHGDLHFHMVSAREAVIRWGPVRIKE
jgi:hypothetical protein